MSSSFPLLIEKKKQNQALSEEEIRFWVEGLADGQIKDYQSAAMLMAIWFNGMSFEETLALTQAMADSGGRLQFEGLEILADKHSTGGVGDKVSLILAPILAACGLPVAMLSGRGLGFTGGTIDKLEALAGVSCAFDNPAMAEMLEKFGWANAQASERIAPADRRLYRLRDVTATVDSIPLITASILSKKIAGGATHLCLDVKCGASAFMQDLPSARSLASNLKTIGEMGGLSIEGVISRMDEPLGAAIGNYLELLESVHCLKRETQSPLMELVYVLGAKMLRQCGVFKAEADGRAAMRASVASGAALSRLFAYLDYAGGEAAALKQLERASFEDYQREAIVAEAEGWLAGMHGRRLGEFLIEAGAGRKSKEDVLDPLAGLLLNKQVGDRVAKGETLAWLYGKNAPSLAARAAKIVNDCCQWRASAIEPPPLVIERF